MSWVLFAPDGGPWIASCQAAMDARLSFPTEMLEVLVDGAAEVSPERAVEIVAWAKMLDGWDDEAPGLVVQERSPWVDSSDECRAEDA